MKKILYIDYWTNGIHNFLRIDSMLRQKGFETQLLHFGSLVQPNVNKEEVIHGILCRDFSYYRTFNLQMILEQESPDVLLMLNTTRLLDRALVRLGKALGIPVIYMMHGIRSTEDTISYALEAVSDGIKWRRYFSVAPKYLKILLPMYVRAALYGDAYFLFKPHLYRLLWLMFKNPAKALFDPPPAWDMHCTRALLYSKTDYDFFVSHYGYPPKSIRVVGNPELDEISDFLQCKNPNRNQVLSRLGLDKHSNYVLYIDEALVENALGGWTDTIQKKFLYEMWQKVVARNKILVIKLHPSSDMQRFKEMTKEMSNSMIIVKEFPLIPLIYYSDVVLGHFSTVNMAVIAMDKPLIIMYSPDSTRLPDVYAKTGGGLACSDVDQLDTYLCNLKQVERSLEKTRPAFKALYIGPLDFKARERIIEEITATIE